MPTTDSAVIKVAFADDHPTLLWGLQTLFETDKRYRSVGVATSAGEALSIVRSAKPQVLFIDLSMPGDVYGTIAEIKQTWPQVRLIVFTAYANTDLALKAFDAGARGFVLKGRPTGDLYEAITSVRNDEVFVSPGFSASLEQQLRSRRNGLVGTTPRKLSRREKQLVQCLLEGKSNREIADTLNLSEKTIKHYMSNLMTKLQVKSRLEVVLAIQSNWHGQETAVIEDMLSGT